MRLFRRILVAAAIAGVGPIALIATAGALQNPTTGQPGAPAGVTCGNGSAMSTPGATSGARGSAFNPNGVAGTVYAGNDGTASLANANSTAAVSEYDVACLQVSTH